jgi:hypothetical protein
MISTLNPAFHFLFQELFALIYWRIKYLKLKYGFSLLKMHEKYKKYIFRIIFYVSLIKNDKQTKKGKEINIFKSIFIFILKTTGTFTPVHSAGYLILRNEFRSTQEVARQNIQVSFYIRSMGLW